jgi:hypothetical protein
MTSIEKQANHKLQKLTQCRKLFPVFLLPHMGNKDAENYTLLYKWLGDMATRVFKNGTKVSVPLQLQQHSPRETVPSTAKDTKLVGVRYGLDAAKSKSLQLLGIIAP